MTDAVCLTTTLNGAWHGHSGTAPCPVCQAERRRDQHALSLSNSADDHLLVYCHKSGCGFREILQVAGLPTASFHPDPATQREAAAKQVAHAAIQRDKAVRLWESSCAIRGTKGEAHLRGRGITCTLPETLRWVADTWHPPSARYLSVLVAKLSTGGVHRTFFERSGQRVSSSAKMMLGPCAGGAVHLTKGAGSLVIAEGIETALSLACGLLDSPATIWAALSTSGMKALHLPDLPGKLIVAADGDAPGRDAARILAQRAVALGWDVFMLPAPDGADWNDVLQGKVAA